ncbi:hypothetical protein D3C72_1118260 [compost metagenome]
MQSCGIPCLRSWASRLMHPSSRRFPLAPMTGRGGSSMFRRITTGIAVPIPGRGTVHSSWPGRITLRGSSTTSSAMTATAWVNAFRPAGWTSGACTKLVGTAMSLCQMDSEDWSRDSLATAICNPPRMRTASCKIWRRFFAEWRTGPARRFLPLRTCPAIRSTRSHPPTLLTASSAMLGPRSTPATRSRWCRGTIWTTWGARRSSMWRIGRAWRAMA